MTHGVDNDLGARDNTYGGTGALERNVLSGNSVGGIELAHTTASVRNQIIGNYIGTDLTGSTAPSYTTNGTRASTSTTA